jgi:hypothetical protein
VTRTITVEPGDSDQAVVSYTMRPGARRRFQVINVRQGKIVHIQDVRSRREALVLAGVRPMTPRPSCP